VISDDAIVNPPKPRTFPQIGPLAVMAATQADMDLLCELLHFAGHDFRRLFTSRLYGDPPPAGKGSVVGPFIGAPYAAMLLETLVAWGAGEIIFLGWCGAVSPEVSIGDLVLPTSAVVDEGTSPHYGVAAGECVQPSPVVQARIRNVLNANHIPFHEGGVWTTDGAFRETRRRVADRRRQGLLAVEMEFSALCSVARFRGAAVGGILVVSDEVFSDTWRPGFRDERFRHARRAACRVVSRLWRKKSPQT